MDFIKQNKLYILAGLGGLYYYSTLSKTDDTTAGDTADSTELDGEGRKMATEA